MTTTFANAILDAPARTENGMKARESTGNALTNLFFNIGSMRGKTVIPLFVAAYKENPDLALRVALWARDIRSGAGERAAFREICCWLSENYPDSAIKLMFKIPEIGRFDDLFSFNNSSVQNIAFEHYTTHLMNGNKLAAKWAPRKGPEANSLRKYMGLSPKNYRKLIVGLSKTVEQQMCANDWFSINYSHVPSVASGRYMKAFYKHDAYGYSYWKENLKTGNNGAKINAGAVYPYNVINSLHFGDKEVAIAQWNALPNYLGEGASILPLVDVSGSMNKAVAGNISALEIALSLGLYTADKNKGAFKDIFMTFSAKPKLLKLKGDLYEKMCQMERSEWGFYTDLNAAFEKILEVAINASVPQSEMPKTLLILSDMQFDACVKHDDSAIEMIRRKYSDAGYEIPNVVFWNLCGNKGNAPVKFDERGTALVSGFSPSIMTSLLDGKNFTPEAIMLKTIMSDRYSI